MPECASEEEGSNQKMSTHACIRVFWSKPSNGSLPLVYIYRQYDGTPPSLGTQLQSFFNGYEILDGISGDAYKNSRAFNGMDDMAAQLVASIKTFPSPGAYMSSGGFQVGNVYLYPPDTTPLITESYQYDIYMVNNIIMIDVYNWKGTKIASGEIMGIDMKLIDKISCDDG